MVGALLFRDARLMVAILALTLAACSASGGDSVSRFPSRQVTLVVGYGPGGGVDTAARGIQPYLQKALGTTVIVENRPGNNALIAANHVLSSGPDGHTLLVGHNATILHSQLHPDSWKSDKSSVDAFIPIYSWMHEDGNGIVVKKEAPYDSMDDLAAEAGKRPVKLCIAGGLGSLDHVTALAIRRVYGGEWLIIPMDSAAEGTAAVLGGKCDAGSSSPAGASMDPARLKMLAVTMEKRSTRWPDAPTFAELKPEATALFVIGAMAPFGTPESLTHTLEEAFRTARNDPGFIAWAERTNQPIGEGWDRKRFHAFLKSSYANFQQIIPELRADLQKTRKGN
jgi:tripartite-type tricarboxylate transporter receptor subunit TctC